MGFIKAAINDLVTENDAKLYLILGIQLGMFSMAAFYKMI